MPSTKFFDWAKNKEPRSVAHLTATEIVALEVAKQAMKFYNEEGPQAPHSLPDFCWEHRDFGRRVSPAGQLFVRLAGWPDAVEGSAAFNPALFHKSNLTFIAVVKLPDRVEVLIVIDGKNSIVIPDDVNLFPSDTLIAKIATLKR